jgi:hypothetical protein
MFDVTSNEVTSNQVMSTRSYPALSMRSQSVLFNYPDSCNG